MRCVVFGGAGFLGEHICRGLLTQGYEVVIYDRASDKLNDLKGKYPNIQYIEGDFIKDENVSDILSDVQVIFHLISTTVPSNTDITWDINSNIIPTIRLLEACVKNKVEKVIYFSSGGTVYGIPQTIPISEEDITNPICSYGIQKLMIEKYLNLYRHNYGLNYNILRLANPYGEGQAAFGSQGVIAAFLARAILEQPLQIWGDSGIIRDFIYIKDVVDASLKVINYKGGERIFNIGSGKGISLQDIIFEIRQVINGSVIVEHCEGRKQDVPINVLNITNAKNELRWHPKISLKEGIRRMKDSWDDNSRRFIV